MAKTEDSTVVEKRTTADSFREFLFVLVFTAGIVVWGAPTLLRKVADSRITAMADLVAQLRTGLVRYNVEVGTLLPLDPAGMPVAQRPSDPGTPWSLGWILTRFVPPSGQGEWEHFHGPYFAGGRLEAPLIGTSLRLGAGTVGTGTRLVPAPPTFDLTGTGNASMAIGHLVAWLEVSDVVRRDFEALDARLDGGIGSTPEQRQRQGEVLWTPEDGGTLLIHLAHR